MSKSKKVEKKEIVVEDAKFSVDDQGVIILVQVKLPENLIDIETPPLYIPHNVSVIPNEDGVVVRGEFVTTSSVNELNEFVSMLLAIVDILIKELIAFDVYTRQLNLANGCLKNIDIDMARVAPIKKHQQQVKTGE